MNRHEEFCPNLGCPARGQQGKGNIGIHSQIEHRYIYHEWGKTFSATQSTVFYRLRTDAATVMIVITLLAYGCPAQAIVQAFGFDSHRRWLPISPITSGLSKSYSGSKFRYSLGRRLYAEDDHPNRPCVSSKMVSMTPRLTAVLPSGVTR